MVIKRVTIELDDTSDPAKSTAPPDSLIVKKEVLPEIQGTSTPEQQDDYREPAALENNHASALSPERIGHTPSDLIFTFISRPEFVPTALTLLAILIFARRLHSITDFWLPLVASFLLNIVWFGVGPIVRAFKNRKPDKTHD